MENKKNMKNQAKKTSEIINNVIELKVANISNMALLKSLYYQDHLNANIIEANLCEETFSAIQNQINKMQKALNNIKKNVNK